MFDFHDGEILGIRLHGHDAVVMFRTRQDETFRLTFRGVVGVQTFGSRDPERRPRIGPSLLERCLQSHAPERGRAAGDPGCGFVQANLGNGGQAASIVFRRDLKIEKEI